MPGLYAPYKFYSPGEVLTAADLNATDQNHIQNQTPQMTDDYQLDVSQKRTQTAPASGLATSLAGEIEQIRYVLAKLGKTTFWDQITAAPSVALQGYKYGLEMSNDPGDIDNDLVIGPGVARSDDDTTDMKLVGSMSKRLDAVWAVGSGNGMLDGGIPTANTTYFIWLIERVDTEVVDILASTSPSSPTMPTNYTKKRLVWAIRTDATNKITQFMVYGEWVMLRTPVLSVDVTNLSTARSQYALQVPNGFRVEVLVSVLVTCSQEALVYLASPESEDLAPSLTAVPLTSVRMINSNEAQVGQFNLFTNTAMEISARSSRANTTLRVAVLGYRNIA